MLLFSPALFRFLEDLSANNDRTWFAANKGLFEAEVKAPLHALVHALAPRFEEVDPEVVANDKSVFRIHRDTRFSKNKAPYKTHAAAQFQRGTTRGPSATGYYLHLAPRGSFFAGGLWMPEPTVAMQIRTAIAANPAGWIAARDGAGGLGAGESLVRVPKPWTAEHPLAEDLRRKSFIAAVNFTDADVTSPDFARSVVAAAARIAPLVAFLAGATAGTTEQGT